jgi:hypothetical protein
LLASSPSSVASPAGWTDSITHAGPGDGFGIQWVASPSSVLTPSASLTGFSFDSSDAPSSVFRDSAFSPGTPASTSFVYHAGPFSDAGFQFVATPVPEPSAWAMLLIGFVALCFLGFRRSQALRSA